MKKKIAIASDHAGFELKERIKTHFADFVDFKDFGTQSTESMDYPDVVHPLCIFLKYEPEYFGILICGSGNGVAMTANKHPHIRAAICWNTEISELARKHNDANVLCLPARFISPDEGIEMVKKFLHADFEGGRHSCRVEKIPVIN